MTSDNKIDKIFRDAALNFEEKPPIDAWDNISEALDNKKRQRKLIFIRAIAATVALFLSFTAGYYFSKEKTLQNYSIAQSYKQKNNIMKSGKTIHFNTDNSSSSSDNNLKHTTTGDQKQHKTIHLNSKSNKPESANKKREPDQFTPMKQKAITLADNHTIRLQKEISYLSNIYPTIDFEYAASEYHEESNMQASSEKKKATHWIVGGDLAPVYSYRTANDKPNVFNTYNENYETTNEKGLFTYAGGLNVGYELSKKFTLQSGVYYAQIGQVADNVNFEPEFTPPDYSSNDPKYSGNTSAGKLNTDDDVRESKNSDIPQNSDDLEVDNLEQNFQYLEVPLIAKYKFLDKKLDLQIIGGLNTGLLIGNNLYKKDGLEKNRIGETENINKYIYNTITGIGMEYQLNKRITMSLEPTMKYSIMSINETQSFHYRPYSFGIFTGINFKLK